MSGELLLISARAMNTLVIETMSYDPKTNKSYWPATSSEHCKEMSDRYGWEQPGFPNQAHEMTQDPVLKVRCIFVGDCQFPPSRMDLTQGESNDD